MRKILSFLSLLFITGILGANSLLPIINFSVGRVLAKTPGKAWVPVKQNQALVKGQILKLDKKTYLKIQLNNRFYTLSGPQIISVEDLLNHEKDLEKYLRKNQLRHQLSDVFRVCPPTTVGVRAEEGISDKNIEWSDDSPSLTSNSLSLPEKIKAAYLKGDHESIILELEKSDQQNGKTPDLIFYLAAAYFFEGQYQSASRQFERITPQERSTLPKALQATATLLHANSLYYVSNYPGALKKLEEFIALYPEFANKIEIYHLLLQSYLEIGNKQQAQKTLFQAENKFPEDPLLLEMKQLLQNHKAVESFQR
ncbi:MAG: hypothetical protein CVV50_01580 [Spirochaetae bacterium HGW-Spirochaetae-6]|jgi:tetratricopeptide (TPR) repeat protein|nr:MAG: hypothetical protein CVV50_01580 [Spirochaetae bacterium HGW-Spirochaetae-6]